MTSWNLPALTFATLAAAPLVAVPIHAAAIPELTSPDGRIAVSLQAEGGLSYQVRLGQAPLIATSQLGLVLADGTRLGKTPKVLSVDVTDHDATWDDAFGKSSKVRNHYRELHLRLREPRPAPAAGADFDLIIRAYDDGIALRYILRGPSEGGNLTVTEDLTEFLFDADHKAWIGAKADAECLYPEIRLSQMPADRRILPLVVETPKAVVAVAEADARDWAGSMLVSTGKTGAFGARAALASHVELQPPRESPWHAILIAPDPGALTVSTLLRNLASPSMLTDTSWIEPGISAWDVWWSGRNPYWSEHNGLHARGNTQSHKDYINFAAEMGWPYMLVDWFWYDQESKDPETAIKPQPHIDMPALMDYAKSKGVKLILWVNSKNVPSIGAEKLLETYARWGASGVKIDFFPDNGSQATQRWMEDLTREAAKHRLVVDFHGVYTPTGLSRTWPNLLTQEGVLGVEYVKLGCDFTPKHMIQLPFTRGLLGPADVTPGGFLNVRGDEFAPNSIPSTVTGTRARQLALAMLIDSPFLTLADAPDHYRGQPGLGFYRGLPTTWDETRVFDAVLMKRLVQARRKGDGWWLAGMNDSEPVDLELKLDFLGEGNFELTTYTDLPESNERPAALAEKTSLVKRSDVIHVRIERDGGFAARLKPAAR